MTWTDDEPEGGWVAARHACTTIDVFLHLRRGIEKDIAARNALTPAGLREPYRFRIADPPGDRRDTFAIVRDGSTPQAIDVSYTPTTITLGAVTATLTLNLSGACRLVVDGYELEGWQVRKLALERLFFQD